MARYKLLRGTHSGPDGKRLKPGDEFESDQDLLIHNRRDGDHRFARYDEDAGDWITHNPKPE